MIKKIILGGGCFWCTEAIFKKLKGVQDVIPGYTGSSFLNPTYRDICTGQTGHAEVVKIHYNTNVITLKTILDVFFQTHDPTTINRQGNDVGSQYRSCVFSDDPIEKKIIKESISIFNQKVFKKNKIVTTIEHENVFYKAENYHKDYFEQNPKVPYCSFVISPKIKSLLTNHTDLIK